MDVRKIYIVEDDFITRSEEESMVSELGYHVCGSAVSGEAALEEIARLKPDAVLMDISLGGQMDGIEAAGKVLERWGIPVIFVTANSNQKTLNRAKEKNPYGFVVKPFDEKELKYVLEMALFRYSAEQKLKESERRLQLAIDVGEHGFWDWNITENSIYFSPRYFTMLGYEPDELSMELKTFEELMHPDDRINLMPVMLEYIEHAQPYTVEFRLKCKDGSWRWISGRGKSYELSDDGKPHRAVGVNVDIHEAREAKEALEKSEAKFRAMVENSSEGIYIRTLEGTIVFSNERFARILELPPDEVVGMNTRTLLDSDDYLAFQASPDMARVQQGLPMQFEIKGRTRNKVMKHLVIHTRGLDTQEGELQIFGIVNDVTERKESEIKLSESLREANTMNRLMQGREERIVEMKREVNALLEELGQPNRYKSVE